MATLSTSRTAATSASDLDAGLRAHMLQVYNYLAAGLGVSALVAWTLFQVATTTDPTLAAMKLKNGVMLTAAGKSLYTSPWMLALCIAPIVILIVMAIAQAWLGVVAAQVGYWLFVATFGCSASGIFLVFKLPAIFQVLAITSASFAALSLYGYTTKRDLSGWGSFLFMGLMGLILAGILNLFLKSDALTFAKAAAGVVIFAGFTAYDTQQLKDCYVENAGNPNALKSSAIWGALNLFLDFANLLLDLLQLFGDRR